MLQANLVLFFFVLLYKIFAFLGYLVIPKGIGSVAETSRAPFNLTETEWEFVSRFVIEHAAINFWLNKYTFSLYF